MPIELSTAKIRQAKNAETKAGRPRLDALTSLRFFAALHVVLFHLQVEEILSGGPWWYQHFAGIGFVGVNFFFVLSGFILVYTYDGPNVNVRRFWRARLARIYPAYLLSLAVTGPYFFHAVEHLDVPFYAWSRQHLPAACLLTVGLLQAWHPQAALTWNPVCWSLSVEAFFYLAFPLLLRWLRGVPQSKLMACLLGCWLASLSFASAYVLLHPDGFAKINSGETTLFWKNFLSFNPLVRLPEFVAGMATARLLAARKGTPNASVILVAGGALGVAATVLCASQIPNPLISTGLLTPAFAVLIYGLASRPRWAAPLQVRWLVVLGEASYSLYLLHSIVITNVFYAAPLLPRWLRVAVSIAAALGASLLCYFVIEKPGRRLLQPKT